MEKIFVVEDSRTYRDAFKGALQLVYPEAEIIGARGFREALNLINNHQFQLVILDGHLEVREDMGLGVDLVQYIKAKSPATKIIFVSNDLIQQDRAEKVEVDIVTNKTMITQYSDLDYEDKEWRKNTDIENTKFLHKIVNKIS